MTFAHYRNRFCMFRTYYALATGKVKPEGFNIRVIELPDPPSREQEEALIRGDVQVANLYRFSPALNRDQKVAVWVSFPVTFAVVH